MKKNIFTILYRLDKNVYGEQINPNKYLSTATLLCCILSGVLFGGSGFLGDMFDWNINIPLTTTLAVVICLIGLNIAESIIAAESAKVAALRSLMMAGILALGFVGGLVGSVIVLGILTIIIAIYLFIIVLRIALGGGGSGGGRRIVLDDGTELKNKESDLFGGGASYKGNDGKRYHTDDGQTFHQE